MTVSGKAMASVPAQRLPKNQRAPRGLREQLGARTMRVVSDTGNILRIKVSYFRDLPI
jgi:hypothetical protein